MEKLILIIRHAKTVQATQMFLRCCKIVSKKDDIIFETLDVSLDDAHSQVHYQGFSR